MGLTALTLVEETRKSCHFTAEEFLFRHFVSRKEKKKKKRRCQKRSRRKVTKPFVLQFARRFTWPYCLFLDRKRLRLSSS